MEVVRLPMVLRGLGLSLVAWAGPYILTRPVLLLYENMKEDSDTRSRRYVPYGEILPSGVAAHNFAAKTAVILPAPEALAFRDVPYIDGRVLTEAHEGASLRQVVSCGRRSPPDVLDGRVHLDAADDVRATAARPVNEVDVAAGSRDSEERAGRAA